jgi:hypothetical protein
MAASVILMGVVACDGAPGISTEPDGAGIVLERSDVNVLGTSESIAAVADLEVLSDGTVWVLNSVEPLFVAFDANGTITQMRGRLGGGPDEFGAPAGFVLGGVGGEVWIFDQQRHAMIEVSRSDPARSEVSLPQDLIPPGSVLGTNPFRSIVRMWRVDDELVLPRRSGDLESSIFGYWLSVWTADIIAVDVSTRAVREVAALAAVLGDPMEHVEMGDTPLPFPLWFRLWTVCSANEIRVHDRLRNELRGFTRDGVELEATALPPVRLEEVTPREFARATFDLTVVEGMGEVPNDLIQMSSADSALVLDGVLPRLNATSAQLASLLPRYVDLHCDEAGTQWIQSFDIDAPGPLMAGLRGSRRWLRITLEGEVQEVHFPDNFDPYRFTRDRIWGVQRDELDVASVAWVAAPGAP